MVLAAPRASSIPSCQPDPLRWQLSHAAAKQKLRQTILIQVELQAPGELRAAGKCPLGADVKEQQLLTWFFLRQRLAGRVPAVLLPSRAACLQIQD